MKGSGFELAITNVMKFEVGEILNKGCEHNMGRSMQSRCRVTVSRHCFPSFISSFQERSKDSIVFVEMIQTDTVESFCLI